MTLEPKHIKFIDAYLRCDSISDICKECNISLNTYYSYIKKIDIKREINRQLDNILEDTKKILKSNLCICSAELIKIIKSEDTPPQTKLNAINSVFNITKKLKDQEDIIDKMSDLGIF